MKRLLKAKKTIFIALILFLVFQPGIAYCADIDFTEEEKEYIEQTSLVTTGVDPEFIPYEFIDNDWIYKGMAADYLKLVEVKTGLHFDIIENISWPEAYDLALEGKVDVLPCVGITEQRKQYFIFTDTYLTFQRVLLSGADSPTYRFSDIDTITIGVQRNSSHYSYVISQTDITPELYDDVDELLLALSNGEIDAVIANYATSRYKIKQMD